MFNDIMSSDDYDMRVKWSALRRWMTLTTIFLLVFQLCRTPGWKASQTIVKCISGQIEQIDDEKYHGMTRENW